MTRGMDCGCGERHPRQEREDSLRVRLAVLSAEITRQQDSWTFADGCAEVTTAQAEAYQQAVAEAQWIREQITSPSLSPPRHFVAATPRGIRPLDDAEHLSLVQEGMSPGLAADLIRKRREMEAERTDQWSPRIDAIDPTPGPVARSVSRLALLTALCTMIAVLFLMIEGTIPFDPTLAALASVGGAVGVWLSLTERRDP